MNFNTKVDRDVVDAILESSLWKKAQVDVAKREPVNESSDNEGEIATIPEYDNGVMNEFETPTDVEEYEAPQDSFSLDDLEYVLDNLEEDALMEHAMNMLDVFDTAYEALNEASGDEDEEEEEEEAEEAEEAEEEAEEAVEEDMDAGYGAGAPGGSAKAKKIHDMLKARRKKKKAK
jgi:flagellar biosynthesis/type III secretory pathway protein FliH